VTSPFQKAHAVIHRLIHHSLLLKSLSGFKEIFPPEKAQTHSIYVACIWLFNPGGWEYLTLRCRKVFEGEGQDGPIYKIIGLMSDCMLDDSTGTTEKLA